MARSHDTEPVQTSNGIKLSVMLESYKYVSHHAETTHSVVIYIENSAPFYDNDAIIGLAVRKFGLEYVGEKEGVSGKTCLEFRREESQ